MHNGGHLHSRRHQVGLGGSLEGEGITLCDGATGRLYPCRIFTGACWYGRMTKIASKQASVRDDTGPRDPMLRTPVQSRSKEGGVKLGTMEANCLIAHQAFENVRERWRDTADPSVCFYCEACGAASPTFSCAVCHRACRRLESSTTTEVMLNELACDGVCVRLRTQ